MIEPRQIKLDDISRHSQIEQSGPLRIEGKLARVRWVTVEHPKPPA
jgi:hypothetical protein